MPVSPSQTMVSIVVILLAPLATYAQPTESPPAEQVASEQRASAVTVAQSSAGGVIQPAVTPAASPVRRYLVEVVIFNNLGNISSGGELWHRESPIDFDPDMYATMAEDSDTTISPGNSIPETRADEIPVDENPIQYTVLKDLAPHLLKLSSDPKYDVVTHVAWTQPLYEKRESARVPVTLSPAGPVAPGQPYISINPPVTGSIQVFENRLLFVDIDITNEFPAEVPDFSEGSSLARPPGTYRLQEKRRVKLNEIHYFDHPFFGALIRVSRVEPGT